LRLLAWWMSGFEKTCGLMQAASQLRTLRELSSDGVRPVQAPAAVITAKARNH